MTSMANGSFDLAWAGIVIGACGAIVAYLVGVARRALHHPLVRGAAGGPSC